MSFLCAPFRTGTANGLLKAAYPKGKALANAGPAYAPVKDGTGKLAYYCEMNPTELTAVGALLVKSARSDVRSASTNPKSKARLCITLAILKRLIVDCRAHLSFFAKDAVEIIEIAVGVREPSSPGGTALNEPRRDIEVAERAAGAFHAFATYAESTSIGIDQSVTKRYLSILAQFGSLAKEPYTNDSSIPGIRIVGLHAIEGAVNSDILFTAGYAEQARYILPALLYNVLPAKGLALEDLRRLGKEHSYDGQEFQQLSVKRRPLNERKAQSIRAGKGEKDLSARDAAYHAVRTLRTLFGLAHSSQLTTSLEATVDWLDSSNAGKLWTEVDWCCWLADSFAVWTHLQYRFVVLGALVDALTSRIDEPQVTASMTTQTAMLTTILQSETSLVGLGIGEVLAQLLGLIVRRTRIHSSDGLLPSLIQSVAALATHVYYADQINDMVNDIATGMVVIQHREGSGASGQSGTSGKAALRAHSQALYLVLKTAHTSAADILSTVPVSNEKANGGEKEEENGNGLPDGVEPIVKVQAIGKRNPVRPESLQDALTFMCDPDPTVRSSFLYALQAYVQGELQQSRSVKGSHDEISRFYHALHAFGYELATSSSLGAGLSRPASTRGPSRRQSVSAASMIDGASSGSIASPADLALLRDIYVAVHSDSAEASIIGIPALLAIERDAPNKWSADAERRQACVEVAQAALAAAGRSWGVQAVSAPSSGGGILPASVSYGMASVRQSVFGTSSASGSASSKALPSTFAASSSLQRASGHGEESLLEMLSTDWTAERALQRAGRSTQPYNANNTLRVRSSTSIAGLSNGHGTHGHSASRPGAGMTLRAPSVRDLKASLGGASPVSPGNASTHSALSPTDDGTKSGSPSLHRRKSTKAEALMAMGVGNPTGQSPSKSNRLSVTAPPYREA